MANTSKSRGDTVKTTLRTAKTNSNPSLDIDLWDKTMTDLISLIDFQAKEMGTIANSIKDLQKGTSRDKDDL